MSDETVKVCPCGCDLPIPPGNRFRKGHHWKALAVERFWSQVDKSAGPDACWPWTGSRSDSGYGSFGLARKQIGSHRQSYLLTFGPIPDGLWVLHRCDNPPCCNPAHLFLGTPGNNTQDALNKGRLTCGDSHWTRLHPERLLRGEQNPQSKLTDTHREEVIAARVGGETVAELAARFGVHEHVVRRACDSLAPRRPRRKLSWAQVASIREAYAGGSSLAELSRKFDTCISNVHDIAHGISWKTEE
jgi:hypothetical protein